MHSSSDRATLFFSLSEQSPPFCQKNSEQDVYSPSQSPLCKPFTIDSKPNKYAHVLNYFIVSRFSVVNLNFFLFLLVFAFASLYICNQKHYYNFKCTQFYH